MKKSMAIGLAVVLGTMAGMTARAAEGGAAAGADAKTQADALVATAKASIEKAKALVGDEQKEAREKEYAAAARAYAGALEICPGWKLDDAANKGEWEGWQARCARGDLWKEMKRYDKAREEYLKGAEIPPPSMTELRGYIQLTLGHCSFEEGNYIAAEEAYLKAEKLAASCAANANLRTVNVPKALEKVRPLAEQQRKEQPAAK